MRKLKYVVFLTWCIAFTSCQKLWLSDDSQTLEYLAIANQDTAKLSIICTPTRFYGQCEIIYGKIGKDSGDVRGKFMGDTLRGDFHYISLGGNWKRKPIALLRQNNTLHWGTGIEATIFNLPCFLPGEPINYKNPRFIFKPTQK